MIVVRVELHSARTGAVTELARAYVDNQGGTAARRDYRVRTLRGRSAEAFDAGVVQRTGFVAGHPSPREHVWNLVAKCLAAAGYGAARTPAEEGRRQAQAEADQIADLLTEAARK